MLQYAGRPRSARVSSAKEVPKVLPMRPELLKGHLDALLLAVLEPGPQHGYAVIEALRTGSGGALDLPTGTVYPALHRLERAGLIASDWQTVGGRGHRGPGRAAMAGHRVSTTTRTHAQARVDAYLGELAHLLRGPRRRRARILAELRDGLDQAIADQTTDGRTEDQAVESAIDQFGTPRAVADAFAGELATAYARHTIAWYIATGPLVGVWWLLLLQPHPWRVGLLAVLAAIPVIPLIPVAIATAAGTFATTGRLMR